MKEGKIQQRETLCFLTDIENKRAKLDKTKVDAVEKLIKSFLLKKIYISNREYLLLLDRYDIISIFTIIKNTFFRFLGIFSLFLLNSVETTNKHL